MTIHLKALLATAATAAVTTGAASGATVLMDFATGGNNYDTNDLGGLVWNEFNTSVADLKDSTGTLTGWAVDASFAGTNSGAGGGGINGNAGPAPFDVLDGSGQAYVTDDGYYSGTGSSSVTIAFTNLDANTTYNFSAIGGRTTGDPTQDGTIDVTLGTGSSGLILDKDGAVLDFSVTSTASGEITLLFYQAEAEKTATLNAMTISDVPEPGSLALLGLGGLCLVRRRRA